MTLALDPTGGGLSPALPDRRQVNRIAAGIALSLAAHALLLALYRQPAAPSAPAAPAPLTVRLRAAPPPPPVAQPADVEPAPKPVPRAPRPERPVRKSREVIAVPAEARQSTEETYTVEPAPKTEQAPPAPAGTTPHFDVDAARAAARGMASRLASEPDPDKVGTALERLPKPALQTENKYERAIKGTKRADCKDGVPGGLLAPIFLAMDKKDSGCKW